MVDERSNMEETMLSNRLSLFLVPVMVVLLLGLSACTTPQPYRTILNETLEPCEDISDTSSDRGKSMTPEVTKEYQLYFVEFDDQGWLHPEHDPHSGAAGQQLDFLMRNLQEKAKKNNGNPRVSIVLYVHGWKHNAKYDDDNLTEFRKMLKATYDVERVASQAVPDRTPRDVVGIYVGWRGVSLNGPDLLLDTTFWSRKAAALRIAQGTVRELFSRLNVFQHYYNEHEESCIGSTSAEIRPRCGVRMMLIGHSFGALPQATIRHKVLPPGKTRDVRNLIEADECQDLSESWYGVELCRRLPLLPLSTPGEGECHCPQALVIVIQEQQFSL